MNALKFNQTLIRIDDRQTDRHQAQAELEAKSALILKYPAYGHPRLVSEKLPRKMILGLQAFYNQTISTYLIVLMHFTQQEANFQWQNIFEPFKYCLNFEVKWKWK